MHQFIAEKCRRTLAFKCMHLKKINFASINHVHYEEMGCMHPYVNSHVYIHIHLIDFWVLPHAGLYTSKKLAHCKFFRLQNCNI